MHGHCEPTWKRSKGNFSINHLITRSIQSSRPRASGQGPAYRPDSRLRVTRTNGRGLACRVFVWANVVRVREALRIKRLLSKEAHRHFLKVEKEAKAKRQGGKAHQGTRRSTGARMEQMDKFCMIKRRNYSDQRCSN